MLSAPTDKSGGLYAMRSLAPPPRDRGVYRFIQLDFGTTKLNSPSYECRPTPFI